MASGLRTGFSLLVAGCLSGAGAFAQEAPSFHKDLMPIFQDRCVSCHGPEKQKEDLRLDSAEAVQKGSEHGPIYVAGKPEESKLYTLTVLAADHEDIMPPKGDPLTPEQTEKIKGWILAGAVFDAAPAPAPDAAPAPAPAPEAAPAAAAPAAAGTVDFATQLWPILSERCVSCHGVEKQKGELRLDSAEAILKGGESGPAVAAGKPGESPLCLRISLPAGHEDIMPPKGDPLSQEQIGLIAAWITEGANFGDWKGGEAVMPKENAPAASAIMEHVATAPVVSAFETKLAKLSEGVAPAAPEALAAIEAAGGLAMPLAQSSPLVRVGLSLAGDTIGDEQLALLAPLRDQLAWLELGGTKITDAGLAQIAGFPRLTRLNLDRTGVGDVGLAHLAGLAQLEYLNLYGTKVTDAGVQGLCGLPELKQVYTWQSGVTDEGAAKLASAKAGLAVNNGWKEPAPAAGEAPPAPVVEGAAAPDGAAAPAAAPAIDLALFFDAGGCCAGAKAGGKECDHPCCAEARAKGELCAQCNAAGAGKLALAKQFKADGCCAKSLADGKECDHPCCAEARAKGEVCKQCNPPAA